MTTLDDISYVAETILAEVVRAERMNDYEMYQMIGQLHDHVKCKYWLPVYATCDCCGRQRLDIDQRRMNTQYVDDIANMMQSCLECFERVCRDYQDLWDEYYRGLL
jgi:hypothetical protein